MKILNKMCTEKNLNLNPLDERCGAGSNLSAQVYKFVSEWQPGIWGTFLGTFVCNIF